VYAKDYTARYFFIYTLFPMAKTLPEPHLKAAFEFPALYVKHQLLNLQRELLKDLELSV